MDTRPLRLAVVGLVATSAVHAQTSVYRVTNLGQVPGASAIAGVGAEDISPDGSAVTGGSWDPYVWTKAGGIRRLSLPAGQVAGLASSVNDIGFVAGYAGLSAPPNYRAVTWDPSGGLTELHEPAWVWSLVDTINNSNEMLMTIASPNGTSLGESHAFFRSATGELLDLTAGSTSGSGIDLNDAGQVLFADSTGSWLREPSGHRTRVPNTYAPVHLNQIGQVMGSRSGDIARWSAGSGWEVVPDKGLNLQRPGGINSFGQMGASHAIRTGISPPRFAYFGHLYTDGVGWIDLVTLVDPSLLVRVYQVEGITDSGAIAISAAIGPDNRALLLEPRHVAVLGHGCPDGNGSVPKALIAGNTVPGGRIALLGAGGSGGGAGVVFVAARDANLPLPGGCALLVDPDATLAVPVVANAAGQVSVGLQLPGAASGFSVWTQYLVIDPSAPNGAFALSNGVRLDVP